MHRLWLIDVRAGSVPAVEAALARPGASLSELAAVAARYVATSQALLVLAERLSGRPSMQ